MIANRIIKPTEIAKSNSKFNTTQKMDSKSDSLNLFESLQMDTNDETEFELGTGLTGTEMPTLESILNERDSDNDDDLSIDEPTLLNRIESTTSLTSTSSPLAPSQASINGIACKHTILTQISAQLTNATDRGDAGQPSALAIAQLIAIGTTRGLILLFDSLQLLKAVIKTSEPIAITALAFNTDSSRILAGNARGLIYMYDTTNSKLLRTISDAHPLGNPILSLKFSDDPKVALFSDSGGSVFTLDFKRKMGMRTYEANCVFSGSRGEVVSLEPLRFAKFYESLNIDDTSARKSFDGLNELFREFTFVAMASFTRLFIVLIKPHTHVLFVHPLSGSASSLPILSWQFVIIQSSTNNQRIINPIVAYARESTIQFIQIHYHMEKDGLSGLRTSSMANDSALKFRFVQLRKNEFNFKIFNFCWLNAKTLAVLDHVERVHIVDIRSNEQIQVVSLDSVQLVYSSAFFKGVATGGYVSKALASAGQNACYQSFVPYLGQLFMLGRRSVHLFALQSWSARIDDYVNAGQLDEALDLTLAIYGNRTKAVIGLPVDPVARHEKIVDKLIDLLHLFINRKMKQEAPQGGRIEILERHYRELSLRCVQLCLAVNRIDLLFSSVYDLLSIDELVEGFFFESLQESIVRDDIKHMPAPIMKRFVEYYVSKGLFGALERCLVHFDVASLDLHQVSVLCRERRLIDALIYISNKAMRDYLTPINDLLELMDPLVFLKTSFIVASENVANFGNKLLVYLHCCLCGQAYPFGSIDDDIVDSVRKSCFEYLVAPNCDFIAELVQKQGFDGDGAKYPLLRILINFNIFDFLNVISMAFGEQSFDAVMGLEAKQRFVDILIEIMLQDDDRQKEFSISQLGVLFTFVARQIANLGSGIRVESAIFSQIISHLCMSKHMERFEEREQTLIALLNAFNMTISQFYPLDELVTVARRAGFYRACEILYEIKGDFHEILECYLNDEVPREKRHEVFGVLKKLVDGFYENRKRRQSFLAQRDRYLRNLREKLLQAHILRQMVEIDARETVYMLWVEMNIDLKEIVGAARRMNSAQNGDDSEPGEMKRSNSSASLFSVGDTEPFELFYVFMRGLFELVDIIKSNKKYIHYMSQFSSEYLEMYVEQMCAFEPAKVQHFLKAAASEFAYRTEECLRICRERRVWDATAFLLEKSGQIEAAFAIHLEKLDALIKQLEVAFDAENERDIDVAQMKIASLLVLIVELCQRGSCTLNDAIKEKIWFSMFDHVMMPLRTFLVPELKHLKHYSPVSGEVSGVKGQTGVNIKLFEGLTDFFKKQGSYIINSMLGYINLGVVIDKVISDSAHSITKFGDVKELILKMIEVYNYEKTLLDKTSSLVSRDVHRQLVAFKKVCGRSLAPLGNCCQYCAKSLTEMEMSFLNDNSVSSLDAFAGSSSSIQLFQCGHAYHRCCLDTMNRVVVNCPECFPVRSGKSEMVSPNINNSSVLNTSEVSVKSAADKHDKYQSLSVSFTPSYSVSENSGLSEQQVNALKAMRTRTSIKGFVGDASVGTVGRFSKSSTRQQSNISLAPANIAKFI